MRTDQKRCPKCGAPHLLAVRVCSCGHAFMPPAQVQAQQATLVAAAPMLSRLDPRYSLHPVSGACPKCDYRDIRSVRTIFAEGASNGQIKGGFGALTHYGGGGWSQTAGGFGAAISNASVLAQYLAPPMEPRCPQRSYVGTIVLVLLGGFFFLFGVTALSANSGAGSSLVLMVVAIALLVGSIFMWRFEQSSFERQVAEFRINHFRWHECMMVWDVLLYCPRCDQVHDPVARRMAPSHQVATLLP